MAQRPNLQGCFFLWFADFNWHKQKQESDIALLLRAVLQEAVHQLRVDEVSRLEVVEDPVATMVGNSAQDGKAGNEHGVVVVPAGGLLAQPDKGGQASHRDQLLAHRLHTAQPGEGADVLI